jgi:hypothetical protein
VLQRFLGTDATAWGNPVYVNLLTGLPTDDGSVSASPTVTEWNAARVAVYNSLDTADANGIAPYWGGLLQDGNLVEIVNQRVVGWDGTALANIGTNIEVLAVGVFESAGVTQDMIYWDELTDGRIINNGDYFEFGVGRLKIRED